MVFLSLAAPFLLIQGGSATGEGIVHGWSIANGEDAVVNIMGKLLNTDARWRNSFGIFFADAKGFPISGKVHSADSKTDVGKTFETKIKNSEIPSEAKKFGFFVIPDGKTLNSELENGSLVTFSNKAPYDAELNGKKLVGKNVPVLFSNKMLNEDGKNHVMETEDEGTNLTTLKWEDGFDTSFDDLVIDIKVTGEHIFPIEPKLPAIPYAALEKNVVPYPTPKKRNPTDAGNTKYEEPKLRGCSRPKPDAKPPTPTTPTSPKKEDSYIIRAKHCSTWDDVAGVWKLGRCEDSAPAHEYPKIFESHTLL